MLHLMKQIRRKILQAKKKNKTKEKTFESENHYDSENRLIKILDYESGWEFENRPITIFELIYS